MLWGDCCVQLGCPYLCWSLCPHFIYLRSLYNHPLATGHKCVLWKYRCTQEGYYNTGGVISDVPTVTWAGHQLETSPSVAQKEAEQGRDIFPEWDRKAGGLKAEGKTTECLNTLETTEGCGTTFWWTTLRGHCEIQRELTTDLHNTPIKLYYVTQSEPHYWPVKRQRYEFSSLTSQYRAECQNFWTNVAIPGFSGCKLLQARVHVKRRESCGCKFQSIHEMHIQLAGIKLSKTWTHRMC